MPIIMTMNGEQHSLAATPLDLRTTHRERGSSGATSPDSRVTGDSPASPACTETDCIGEHIPTVKADSARKDEKDAPLRLPFRKRKINVEPETQTENGDVSPRTPPGKEWTSATAKRAHEEDGYRHSVRVWPQFQQYGPYYCHVPIPDHSPPPPPPHQTDLLCVATRQDEDGDTPLHIAVVQGEIAMVRRLLQILIWARRSPDIYNNLRQTPLHLAVITQQAMMVEALLRAGADPAALDRNGQTALHLCCEYDQADCLSLLLAQPSSPACMQIRNYEGLSPLHLAVLRSLKDLARLLLNAGADINAMDIKSGQSPLMHAVESNNANMVHFLIENSCDVNSQSYSGNTALHCACGRGQADTVRLLLKNGADSTVKNYHNDTPLMVTTNKKIADVLRGRSSKQIRLQDQTYVTTSPTHGSLTESGSPSPNQSRGCSPSTPLPQQQNSRSPQTPAISLFSRHLVPTSASIYPVTRMDYD